MSRIDFGDPRLIPVRRVGKYELHGVAFIEGHEKPVAFHFEGVLRLELILDDTSASLNVYKFFKEIFDGFSEKNEGLMKQGSFLHCSWSFNKHNVENILQQTSAKMGDKWYTDFRTLMIR